MTDDSRILDALRAIIEVVDKARSELPDEPCDPLDEVTSGYAPSTSPNHDAEADAWLEQSGKPRTLRNLLKAYVHARPSTNFVPASSPSTRKWYRILRVRSSRAKHPENDVFSTAIEFTESFPLPLHPRRSAWSGGRSMRSTRCLTTAKSKATRTLSPWFSSQERKHND